MDEVVAQEHGERFVAHVFRRAEHGMAEAFRGALPDRVDRGELVGLADEFEPGGVALGLEHFLELGSPVEVVLDGPLAAAGDQQDVADPGGYRFLHDVLDGRRVDDRQHLLGYRLGGGQEPRSQARGGDDRLPDHC